MHHNMVKLALVALVISSFSFALKCSAQTSDPKIIEAAKKEGGEVEVYVMLRSDTAQMVWKMFEAKEQRLPGRSNAVGLDPAFKEINAEKIMPLSMEEAQANYKKYLDEFRNYFGK